MNTTPNSEPERRSSAAHKAGWIFVVLFLFCATVNAEVPKKASLPKVDLTQHLKGAAYFQLRSGEGYTTARLDHDVIEQIHMLPGENGWSVTIHFLNSTEHRIKPDYSGAVYNIYGVRIADLNITWMMETLAAGESQKQNFPIPYIDWAKLLFYTPLIVSDDWQTPAYFQLEQSVETN